MFVAKYSWDGLHLWSQSVHGWYYGSEGYSVSTDSGGNVLVGGTLSSSAGGNDAPAVLKFGAAEGQRLWTRVFAGSRGSVDHLAMLPDGGMGFDIRFHSGQFAFAGTTYVYSGEPGTETFDHVLAVLGPNGVDRVARALPGMSLDDLTVDEQGSFRAALRGLTVDLGAGPVGPLAVARLTPSLGVQWYRSFDPNLERLYLDGSNATGAFQLPVLHEGRWLATPNRSWDLLHFRLGP
jgi:hypothetical protein